MKFKEKLLQGIFIKRYKRFFVDIKYKNKTITAHCPNSGSMMGLLDIGNTVFFSKSNNLKRKLKYTLQIIKVNKALIGINTHLANGASIILNNNSFFEKNFWNLFESFNHLRLIFGI